MPHNGRETYHCLNIWQIFAVLNRRESIASHHAIHFFMSTPLRFRKYNHSHHPPGQDTHSSLPSRALRAAMLAFGEVFRRPTEASKLTTQRMQSSSSPC